LLNTKVSADRQKPESAPELLPVGWKTKTKAAFRVKSGSRVCRKERIRKA